MFDQLVVSGDMERRTSRGRWRSPRIVQIADSRRADSDSADLHGGIAEGNAEHVSGGARAPAASASAAAV